MSDRTSPSAPNPCLSFTMMGCVLPRDVAQAALDGMHVREFLHNGTVIVGVQMTTRLRTQHIPPPPTMTADDWAELDAMLAGGV